MCAKKINRKFNPSSKQPGITRENMLRLREDEKHYPVWQLKYLDVEHGEWGWKNISNTHVQAVLDKLKNYETMTWTEIRVNRKYNHPVPVKDLVPEAKKRLQELQLEDTDDLFRLRLSGKQRVWGILDRYIFKVLWWDPEHSVCPSGKKHT